MSEVIASVQLYCTVRLLWSKFVLLDSNYRGHYTLHTRYSISNQTEQSNGNDVKHVRHIPSVQLCTVGRNATAICAHSLVTNL
jgi:hypothetical protein